MPIVRQCCGLDLNKTGVWRAIALIAGFLALAVSIWFTAQALFYTELDLSHSNHCEMVTFWDFIVDSINSFNTNINKSIMGIVCAINLMACLSWLFGFVAMKQKFARATLIWWALVLVLYFYHLLLRIDDAIFQQCDHSNDWMDLIVAAFVHFISTVLFVCFYATSLVCYISLKGNARSESRNDHWSKWSPILQTDISIEHQKSAEDFI